MGSKSNFKVDFKNAFSVGDIDAAKTALTGLLNNLNGFKDISGIENLKTKLTEITTALANGNTSQA
jgi:hypothetical protein